MMRKMLPLLKDKGVVVDKEYDQEKNQAVQDEFNNDRGVQNRERLSLGPLFPLKTKELIGLYVKERYATLNVRSSNCVAMKVPQHFVYCTLMVLRKL